jgi:hypothetical protein
VATGFTLDMREFELAVASYARATRKTFAQSGNRQLANLAIKASVLAENEAPAATTRAAVVLLGKTPWWPKLVSKVMGGGDKGRRSRAFQGQWAAANSGTLGLSRSGGVKRKRTQGEFLHAQQAREVSAKLLAKRRRAAGFIKTFFLAAAREMRRAYKGGDLPTTEQPAKFGIKATVHPCTETSGGSFTSAYTLKVRGSGTAARADKILMHYLQRAVPLTIRDMIDYANRELQKVATMHSARRAA